MIQEVEELGGMSKAIEAGLPKMRMKKQLQKKQAKIDAGKDLIIGVSTYQLEKK
ncbi:MAG: hypothetical protein IPO64_11930 [Bacteroidetes bacterium]|nr:hypothetical protein [Bacteroidota bacterium]